MSNGKRARNSTPWGSPVDHSARHALKAVQGAAVVRMPGNAALHLNPMFATVASDEIKGVLRDSF
jgi:hypothetical protein